MPKVLSKGSPKNLLKVGTEEGEIMVTTLIINIIHLEPIHRDKTTHLPRVRIPDTALGHTHPLLHFKSTIILWRQAQVCLIVLISFSICYYLILDFNLEKSFSLQMGF